jgi:Na+(H+)/acetate symporter ActP
MSKHDVPVTMEERLSIKLVKVQVVTFYVCMEIAVLVPAPLHILCIAIVIYAVVVVWKKFKNKELARTDEEWLREKDVNQWIMDHNGHTNRDVQVSKASKIISFIIAIGLGFIFLVSNLPSIEVQFFTLLGFIALIFFIPES